MKLSKLIKTLRAAQKQFGDVTVNLMDGESGNWHPLAEVLKLHPYTAQHGCMNRAEPVNAIALTRSGGHAPDLVLANAELNKQQADMRVRSADWSSDDARIAYDGKADDFDAPCSYDPIVKSIGDVVVEVSDSDYQGDTRVLFKRGEEYGHTTFGWGSCSGCDALQGSDSWKDVAELRNQIANTVVWRSRAEMLDWFATHDWEGDYDYRSEERKCYVDKCVTALQSDNV
jgi:hypothetical protein